MPEREMEPEDTPWDDYDVWDGVVARNECPGCKGSGECLSCDPIEGEACHRCRGSGICRECLGTGERPTGA